MRRAFAAKWQPLAALLDDAWKQYLGPPPVLVNPGQTFSLNDVQSLLQRYERVANAPKYRVLTERTEFQQARAALRQFVQILQMQAPAGSQLKLPAPPGMDGR